MKTQVIIPAAGAGKRFKSSTPKPLVLLGKKPIIVYALEVFQKCSSIDSVIVVAAKKFVPRFKNIIRRYRLSKVKNVVAGGATRRASVSNGLKALDQDTDLVVIHDGARPFITRKLIEKSIRTAQKQAALIVAVPVKPTIKAADRKTLTVEATLKRDTLWEVQTPQIFKKTIIVEAHRKNKSIDPTDDALLVEKIGGKVKILAGDYQNIKITTQEDLIFARAILASRHHKRNR